MAISKDSVQFEQIASWQLKDTELHCKDDLRDCILMLAKYYQISISAKALTVGLPLEDNCLTLALVERAAERAKCESKIELKSLKQLNPLTLPCIAMLKNGKACLLIGKDGENYEMIFPDGQRTISQLTETTFDTHYDGKVVYLKPIITVSDRSEEMLDAGQQRSWFWTALKTQRSIYHEIFLASFLINIFALSSPLFVMNVYDRVVPNHAIDTLWVLAIGATILFVFDFTLKMLRAYFIDVAGKQIDVKLSSIIFEKVMSLRMDARPRSVGAFANSVSSFEAVRDFITSATVTVLVDLPFAFLFILIIAWIGGTLALIPLLSIPLVVLIGVILQWPLIRLTKASYQHSSEKQATLIESLSGIESIKGMSAEGVMQNRWEKSIYTLAKLNNKLRVFSNFGINSCMFITQMVTILMVIVGVYKISAGDMTMGALIACTMLTGRIMAPLTQIAGLLTRYHQSMNSLKSLDNIMAMPSERNPEQSPLHRPKLTGNIRLRNVSFQYPGQLHPCLENINIIIEPGEKVGIIGRIGSGKTTITKLLMGLYQPTGGSILVDDTQISQIDQSDLRHNIGYVPQDVTLFYGTIKENITMGASYVDDNTILEAAKASTAIKFITQHPEGFDMQVGEKGSQLSGGQRQTVVIARAVLLNPSIMLFDEPCNAMDDSTEIAVKTQLEKICADKTTIIVTHKASMLSLVDRVIVIDGGKIVADGPKDSVLQALSERKIKKQD